ncbi:MAG TPA: copper resistance protein CopC [Acidimicrobiales bacterium]
MLLGIASLVPALVSTGVVARPVAAHAKVTGSSPADGAEVDVAPDRVTLYLDAKPATIEGDPLQLYGPDGARVDAADAHVGAAGTELTVTMAAGVPRPAGEYHLLWRVVSQDSHLIAGHFTFRARQDAPPVSLQFAPGADAGSPRWHQAGSVDARVALVATAVAGFAVAAAVYGTKGRRRGLAE